MEGVISIALWIVIIAVIIHFIQKHRFTPKGLHCPKCGKEWNTTYDGQKYCYSCFNPKKLHCPKCGREWNTTYDGQKYCYYCNIPSSISTQLGQDLKQLIDPNNEKGYTPTFPAERVLFWPRVLAFCIDFGLCLSCIIPALISSNITFKGAWAAMVFFLVFPLYQIIMVWKFEGTIGHHVIGAKVIGPNGTDRPKLLSALIRGMVKTILTYSVFGLLFLTTTLNYNNIAIHDLIASTFLVKKTN